MSLVTDLTGLALVPPPSQHLCCDNVSFVRGVSGLVFRLLSLSLVVCALEPILFTAHWVYPFPLSLLFTKNTNPSRKATPHFSLVAIHPILVSGRFVFLDVFDEFCVIIHAGFVLRVLTSGSNAKKCIATAIEWLLLVWIPEYPIACYRSHSVLLFRQFELSSLALSKPTLSSTLIIDPRFATNSGSWNRFDRACVTPISFKNFVHNFCSRYVV